MPERKNLRLKHYDYSQAGYYFVTICTKDKQKLFGQIVGADDPVRPEPVMVANEIGEIVTRCWEKINDIYENVRANDFCLMPNHIHAVIMIQAGGQGRPPLPKIIQGYKSVSTRICFQHHIKTLWQRNYYEHIIRSESEYRKIVEYMNHNPLQWADDKYYIPPGTRNRG